MDSAVGDDRVGGDCVGGDYVGDGDRVGDPQDCDVVS